MTEIDFPQWLQDEMDQRAWTQADLARHSKLTTGAISHVMSGNRKPGPDFCNAVARAFKFPPELVFKRAGLLPESINSDDPRLKEINYLLPGLPEDERQDIVEYVRMKVRIAEEKGEYRGATEPNPST
ncbi:MAG: XRE family transcriptional regulator [Chloroflexi bacterium]|nr:MAG: XRE family transcriptional regulator [Chloroflexota bacterium]